MSFDSIVIWHLDPGKRGCQHQADPLLSDDEHSTECVGAAADLQVRAKHNCKVKSSGNQLMLASWIT